MTSLFELTPSNEIVSLQQGPLSLSRVTEVIAFYSTLQHSVESVLDHWTFVW